MNNKRRISPQQIQENISRKAFGELLELHEWITTDVVPDYGEDVLVRIYDDGFFTGISLYIQLKSMKDIEARRLKSGAISYSFKVSDLEHWESSAVPVLLVIWDIVQKEGHYFLVTEAIASLNSTTKDWRVFKTKRIRFTRENLLDDAAFKKLRIELARYYYPLISKDKDLDIRASFVFPSTPEGTDKLTEFKAHLAAGDEVELSGEFIKEFDLPDWWKRLYGSPKTSDMHVRIGPPKDTLPQPFQFDFISAFHGSIRLSDINLRLEKMGNEEATLSNKQQSTPTKILIIINKLASQIQLNISLHWSNIDGYDARRLLNLQRVLSNDFQVRIKDVSTGNENMLPVSGGRMPAPDDQVVDFVQKICKIQDVTGQLLRFPDNGTFSNLDEAAANELISILNRGAFTQENMRFSIKLRKPAIEYLLENLASQKPISFRVESDESFVEILGKKIQLGPMVRYIRGNWYATYQNVKIWIERANEEDSLELVIKEAQVREEFENWAKEELSVGGSHS